MSRRWRNWAGNVRTTPREWNHPRDEAEIVALVRRAQGRRLRVVGAGHSWSAIAAPEDLAISLDHVAGVIEQTGDEARVRAGTRLEDFLDALAATGRTLGIVGSIAKQALAGAIATGTHGSSLVHGNLASLVTAMRIVDGRGDIHTLTGDRLAAARVHLGALGIVSELTFRTVPAFHLAETVEAVPIDEIGRQLPAVARSAEYVKVWWMPHTRSALVFRYERTTETSAGPDPVRQRRNDERLHRTVFPLVLRLGRIPGLTKTISPWISRSLLTPRRIGEARLMLSTPNPARHRETEAAMPLDCAGEAFDRLVHLVARDRLPVNFIVEARFVPADPAWMSPAHGVDTCQLGAYNYGPSTDAYFATFWREMRALGARPHWGKELDHTAEEIRALFPQADAFRALRDELDPGRLLASAFHTRVLGE